MAYIGPLSSQLIYTQLRYESFVHWNENFVILMIFLSMAAPKAVNLTAFGAASDEKFIKMK